MARRFFYDVDGEKLGPVTGQELLYLRAEGRIDNNTWVRAEDSQTWRPFGHVNLKEERKKAASRSILSQLLRGASPRVWFCIAVLGLALLLLLFMVVAYAWPILLMLVLIIMFLRSINSR